ncbi:RHO1 GDP-GTP exchange protein 2 [Dinochytrium kinnereticum]|nr:RHO1 GDP-GTP exchange protein 2 [Dinochytrium kinnereticum]
MAQPPELDLWETKFPDLAQSVSDKERKRQEKIYELISNQRNLVQELRYVNDRQDQNPQIDTIADLFMNVAPQFTILASYGENNAKQREELGAELARNPQFKEFMAAAGQKNREMSSSGKDFSLKDLLYSPIQRFFKYNELLRDIKKQTSADGIAEVEDAMAALKAVGDQINDAIGRSTDRRETEELNNQLLLNYEKDPKGLLRCSPLRPNLLADKRSKVFEKKLWVHRPNYPPKEIYMFLVDHMLIMTTFDPNQPRESRKYTIWKLTIPLDLIRSVRKYEPPVGANPETSIKNAFTIQFPTPSHQRSDSSSDTMSSYTYSAEMEIERDFFVQKIEQQREKRARTQPFAETVIIPALQASVTCCVAHGRGLIVATDSGVYVVTGGRSSQEPLSFRKVIDMPNVSKVSIISSLDKFFVLSGSSLVSFGLDEVLLSPGLLNNNRGRKVLEDVSFFRVGFLAGKTYVCAVRAGNIRSNIKMIDPTKEKKKFLSSVSELLVEKEFYIPTLATSIDFLKSKLVLGCSRGFEIVDLQKVGAASNAPLMDPKDPDLYFMTTQEQIRPKALFKTAEGDYILCFEGTNISIITNTECVLDVAFRVDRHGRRSQPDFLICWQGLPTHFSYNSPYLIAFSPHLVEVSHSMSGELVQVIHGENIEAVGLEGDELYLVKISNETGKQTLCHLHLRA